MAHLLKGRYKLRDTYTEGIRMLFKKSPKKSLLATSSEYEKTGKPVLVAKVRRAPVIRSAEGLHFYKTGTGAERKPGMWNNDEPELQLKLAELEDKILHLEALVGEFVGRVKEFDSVLSTAFDLLGEHKLKRRVP